MIEFDDVSVTYEGSAAPTLRNATFAIGAGELCVVVGETGVGKSTLLRCVNGLVPHFTGGTMEGRVRVGGRDTREHRPRDLADVVGMVGQDPSAGFVTDRVEEELAYVMESLGVEPSVMRRRVEEMLDLLGLAELRDRPLASLSGGQQQRVAIGGALAAHPRVLVLDEPTSALDPGGAEDVLAALHRLVHDVGITVVLAEHRLERVVQYADTVLLLPASGKPPLLGTPSRMLATSPVAPPVVRLGRLIARDDDHELPVTIRDARQLATPVRTLLEDASPNGGVPTPRHSPEGPTSGPLLHTHTLSVHYGSIQAVKDVSLDVFPGECVAVMGRNGSGKSSLLWALQGSGARNGGKVLVQEADPSKMPPPQRRKLATLVPQQVSDVLYHETVGEECAQADTDARAEAGTCAGHFVALVGAVDPTTHPLDLSEGQRLALAVAVAITAPARVVLLDEPTRGLDYPSKETLCGVLHALAAEGRAVVMTTHDVEFVAEFASRVVVLADGEIVTDGSTRDVVCASPLFAPQVAKVLAPAPYLTVREVAEVVQGCDAS